MVAAPHYLAAAAGLRVLQAGGNAIEAAIAASAVCSVVCPHLCGVGGDSLWLIYSARDRSVLGLNASGRSGERCDIDFYRQRRYPDAVPARGMLAAATVPGAVDGWWEAYRHGQQTMTSELTWSRLFDEAVAYAHGGYPVTRSQCHWTSRDALDPENPFGGLQKEAGFARAYLKEGGRPYLPGELLRQPELAATLQAVVREGGRVFYEGRLGRRIAGFLEKNGGALTARDFQEHHCEWVEPLRTDYRGYQAYSLPPNSQGLAALLILNILSHFDVRDLGEGTADYYHLLVESAKLALADRDRWVTDPDFQLIPLERLLSGGYALERSRLIDMERAAQGQQPGRLPADTVFIGAVDRHRNSVSMLQSLGFDFGSGVVAGDTGVLLHNRASSFSLDPAHPNCLKPRKRTMHTLIPAMLLRSRQPCLVYGTMGGEGQAQTQAALVTRILDFGFGVQEAVSAPRWLYAPGGGSAARELLLERRLPPAVIRELRRRGHPVRVVGDWDEAMGHAQAIRFDEERGVLEGGADPRGDGLALGY
jgi:gamma-glutamyltranspeptidase/glutathione hydrolase